MVKRLKRFAKICNGQDHKSVYDLEGKYPIMGSGGEFGRANTFLHPGPSVLLGRKGTVDKPRYVDFPFWSVDTAYFTDIFSITNPRFFYYLCTTIKFDLYKYGSAVPSMNQEVLGQIEFTSPPLIEQFSSATYLDRKTAEIDQIIANKQKLIALYEEEKQAVINHSVAHGINPDVRIKHSGVEWLGDIPEHWEVKKLKHLLLSFIGGGTPSTANPLYWDGDIPWVSAKDMKQDFIVKSEDYITELAIKESSTHYIEDERIIIVVRSGILKHTFPVAINKVPICINQDLKAIKPSEIISNDFMFWKLKGLSNEILTYCNKMGATVDSIEMPDLLDLIFAFPKIDEQQSIEKESNRLDLIIEKCKKQIELLKEYRMTLISEVVTGKVKVI